MKIRHALAAILAATVLALTACTSAGSSGSSDNPATTTVIETTDPTPAADDMTQTIVDLSWDQQTETDKNSMCDGIALFGPGWAADQMRAGAGYDDSLDWDRAAVLVEAKCAQR